MFFVPISRAIAKERGLKYYITINPCNKGNIAYRLTSSWNCQCADHLKLKTIQRNLPEVKSKDLQKSKEWIKENPDKVKANKKRYAKKHSKTIVLKVKKWGKENPDKVRQNQRNSRKRHKLKRLVTARRWRLINKHKVKSYDAERRIKALNASLFKTELTDFVLEEAFKLNILREKITGFRWHMDHVIPLQSKTVCGLHVWNNFQCLPQSMNNYKSNKLIYTNPHEWLYDIPKFFNVVYQQEKVA